MATAATSARARNRQTCAAWIDWLQKRGRASATTYQYGARLDLFVDWCGDRRLSELSLMDLEEWTTRPSRRGGQRAAATVATDVVVVRGMLSWAARHALLAADPSVDLAAPKVRNTNPRAIDPEVWAKLWASELDVSERAMLGLGFFCGLRREEMCRLRADHLVAGRLIHFPRKGDQGVGTGVFPLGSAVQLFADRRPDLLPDAGLFLGALSASTRLADPWVLPWGLEAVYGARRALCGGPPDGMTNPDQVNAHMRRLLRARGHHEYMISPHALRHSFVTYMLQMGVPIEEVSRLANHSNISITMRYVKVAADPLAKYLTEGSLKPSRWGVVCQNATDGTPLVEQEGFR